MRFCVLCLMLLTLVMKQKVEVSVVCINRFVRRVEGLKLFVWSVYVSCPTSVSTHDSVLMYMV